MADDEGRQGLFIRHGCFVWQAPSAADGEGGGIRLRLDMSPPLTSVLTNDQKAAGPIMATIGGGGPAR